MNIYERLINFRLELQQRKLKKTGKNKFTNFSYYELVDILPTINELCLKYKILTVFNASSEGATLTLIDVDKTEDTINFVMPFENPQIKGANAVQNLGGAVTYLRRYLFLTAFEIVENDVTDAIIGQEPKKEYDPTTDKREVTMPQLKRLQALVSTHQYKNEYLKEKLNDMYNIDSSKKLNRAQYNELCNLIKKDEL